MDRRIISAQIRQWLIGELDDWRRDGLVSQDQSDGILARYELPEDLEKRSRSKFVFVLMTLAAVLFGMAVLLLIGFNWEAMPRGLKLFVCVGTVVAVQGLSYYLQYTNKSRLGAEVLALFGCFLFGGSIWLVAQAYHIESHYPDGVWWWALGILPMALLLDSIVLHLFVTVLLGIWCSMEIMGFSHLGSLWFLGINILPNGAFSLLPLAALGLLWGYRRTSPKGVGLYAGLLSYWACLQIFSWDTGSRGVMWFGSVGAVLLVVADLHQRGRTYAIAYRRWGVLLVAIVLILLGSPELWKSYSRDFSGSDMGYVVDASGLFIEAASVVGLVCLVLGSIAAVRKWRASREEAVQSFPELLARLAFPLVTLLAMAGFAIWRLVVPHELLAWIIPAGIANMVSAAMAVYLIRLGIREDRGQPFFGGVAYLLLWAFARYIDLFADAGGMLGAAALFFLCGSALIGVAVFWSRRKASHLSSPEAERLTPIALPEFAERGAAFFTTHRTSSFAFFGAAQVVLLLAMILLNALPLLVGKTYVLKVTPVDPRDMFRGDYVILSYDLNRLSLPGGDIYDSSMADRTVYVALERNADGTSFGREATFEKPTGKPYIRGRANYGQITYGIEAYYVQETKGLDWERLRNSRELQATVAIAPWGQAKLVSLQAAPLAQTSP